MQKFSKKEIMFSGKKSNLIAFSYHPEDETTLVDVKKIERLHNILILDRSYSMQNSISELVENVITCVESMDPDDFITIIWFSSPDKCQILLSGVTRNTMGSNIVKLLRNNVFCNGLTEFTQPFNLVRDTINGLKDICNNFNVVLFTDGQSVPEVGTAEEDYGNVYNLLTGLCMEEKLLALNTIGYGNYCDENFLINITSYSEFGEYHHISEISDFSKIFLYNYGIVNNVSKTKLTISIPDSKNTASILHVIGDSKTKVSTTNELVVNFIDNTTNRFFILLDESINSFAFNDSAILVADITRNMDVRSYTKATYGYARNLFYMKKPYEAIDWLMQTEDKFLIDSILNKSFTQTEKATTLKLLQKAYMNTKDRLIEGLCGQDYIPNPNAFSVVQFLHELTKINCQYIPIPANEYNRIGRKVKDSLKVFNEDASIPLKADINELVTNESSLNISIRYIISGTVYINDSKSIEGMPESVDVIKYRNQSIVKDGNLNIPKIQIKFLDKDLSRISTEMRDFMNSSAHSFYARSRVHTFDLTQLPIVSREYANVNIENITKYTREWLTAKAKQKVYNALIKDTITESSIMDASTGKVLDLSEQVLAVLKENYGINSRMEYVGKNVNEELSGDKYVRRNITFGIKGCSSIPSINAVNAKVDANKKLNYLETVIMNTINAVDDMTMENTSQEKLNEIKSKNKELIQDLGYILFSAKMCKVLTGGWWSELENTSKPDTEEYVSVKEDCTLVVKTKLEEVEI